MAQVYNRLTLDAKKKNHDIITAVQNDASSRYLDINLIDNGVNINLTGHEVRLYAKKPDQTEVYNNGQITNAVQGRVQIELTSQLLAKEGYVEAQVITYKNNQQILSTLPFKIHVVSNLMSDNAIESSNEYGALVIFYQNLYEAYDLMTTMVQRIGTPGANAQQLNLNTMFKVWDWLIDYMKQNSSSGAIEKIGSPSDTTQNTLFGAMKQVPSYGGFKVFISNGSFKVPPGVTQLKVTGCAAGGDGSPGSSVSPGVGGKAGDGVIGKVINVTPGETLSVTCGPGNTVLGNKLTLLANNLADSIPVRLEIFMGIETGLKPTSKYSGYSGYFGFGGGAGGNAPSQSSSSYYGGCSGGGGGAGGYGAGGGGGGQSTPGDSSSRPGQGGKGYTGKGGKGGISQRDSSYNAGAGGDGKSFGSGGGGGGSSNGHGNYSANSGAEGLGSYKGNRGEAGHVGGTWGGTSESRPGKPGGNATEPPTMPFGGVPGQGFLLIEW